MLKVTVKTALIFSLLFILIVTAICSHPYDGSEVLAFIQPDPGCTNPCIMGIEIGVTTPSEAVAILRTNPWVDEVTVHPPDYHWTWSEAHPAFIRGDDVGRLRVGNGVVQGIDIVTTIPFGDLWETFGPPDGQIFTDVMDVINPPGADYYAVYLSQQLLVWTNVDRRTPFVRRAFWQAQPMLTWAIRGNNPNSSVGHDLAYGLNTEYWQVCYYGWQPK